MAGESARSQYDRLRRARRDKVRDNRSLLLVLAVVAVVVGAVGMQLLLGIWWPGALFGLLLISNLLAPSRREVAWRRGAEGEQAVGAALDALPASHALHDRRIPGSRANIDHILVCATGVWTIDAKNYTGKLETRARGQELWVKGRNRSKLLDQARRQTTVVLQALAAADLVHVPVRPALCFVGVEWPILFTPHHAGDVALVSPRRLPRLTTGNHPLTVSETRQVAQVLDRALRPATGSTTASPPRTPRSPRASTPRPRVDAAGTHRPAPPARPAPVGDVTVERWRRFGQDRLYVNAADGTTLGHVDLQTDTVVPVEERFRDVVERARSEHLRGT